MQEFTIEVKRTLGQIAALLALLAGCSWLMGHAAAIPGLFLGGAASAVYFLLMSYRIRRSAALPPAKAVAYMRSGWMVRLSFIVLILILSLKIPQINFAAAVAGLFSLQIVVVFNAILIVARSFFRK
ncbi:MAG: ATP synthase subunit I [Negativicutes bacterium]|nr:ATP synthase subunit I [Negativicutes bacterium]